MFNINLLPASYGDAILIEYGIKPKLNYILVDGGPYYAFTDIISAIKRTAPELKEIELLVVSHIDIDHIDGIVKLLNQDNLPFNIKQVWYNGYKEMIDIQREDNDTLGPLQGEYLTYLINSKRLIHNDSFEGKAVMVKDFSSLPVKKLDGGMRLTLLSPGSSALKRLAPVWDEEVTAKIKDLYTIEQRLNDDYRYDEEDDILGKLNIEDLQETNPSGDKSAANGSSIAFLAIYEGKKCLLTGDTPSDLLLNAIEPMLDAEGSKKLKVGCWKLAHHGSKKSTLDQLMNKIDSQKVLISSDGKKYKHPDKETVAKLLKHNGPDLQLYFNYRTEHNQMWDDADLKKEYSFQSFYPHGSEGSITLEL